LNEPDHIDSLKGGTIPRRLTVKEISFGAHVDYAQNSKFIQEIGAPHIVLVHGEASQMGRLRAALRDTYVARGQEINIHTPKNCEPLTLTFRQERMVKAIGSLAEQRPENGNEVKGLLVSKDFSYTLLDPKDLWDFTGLGTSTVLQKQSIALSVDWAVVRWYLEGMYGEVEEGEDEGRPAMTVMNAVKLVQTSTTSAELQWTSSTSHDMIADSTLAVLLSIDSSPATVKCEYSARQYVLMTVTSKPHVHSCGHSHGTRKKKKATRELTAEFDKISTFLEAHFGTVSDLRTTMHEGTEDEDELLTLDVELDGVKASVDLISMVSLLSLLAM
jgi:cleavage and polyadenylation specificity factor subunit 3